MYKFHAAQLGLQEQTGTKTDIMRHAAYAKRMPITAILYLKGSLRQRTKEPTHEIFWSNTRPGCVQNGRDGATTNEGKAKRRYPHWECTGNKRGATGVTAKPSPVQL